MKKGIYMVLALLLAVTTESAYASSDVYHCEGETGEPLYSEKPCDGAGHHADTHSEVVAREAANAAALESIRRAAVTVKRELMDLERERVYMWGKADDEEWAEFEALYLEAHASLHARLAHLEQLEAEQVSQSVETILAGQASFNREPKQRPVDP